MHDVNAKPKPKMPLISIGPTGSHWVEDDAQPGGAGIQKAAAARSPGTARWTWDLVRKAPSPRLSQRQETQGPSCLAWERCPCLHITPCQIAPSATVGAPQFRAGHPLTAPLTFTDAQLPAIIGLFDLAMLPHGMVSVVVAEMQMVNQRRRGLHSHQSCVMNCVPDTFIPDTRRSHCLPMTRSPAVIQGTDPC